MLHHHHHSTKTDLSNSHDLQLGEPSPLDPSKGLSGSNGNTSAWKSSVVGDPSPLVGDSSSTGDLTVPITPDTSTASVTVTPSPISSVPPNAVDFNAAPVRSVRSTVGVNLNGIQDYATETPFVDVFKSSRSWISQSDGAPWGQGGSLNLTPDGYIASLKPGQYAETVMLTDSTHFPSGNYTLLYSGDGKITFDSSNATVVSQSPGRMVVNVDKSNPSGVFMAIRETNPDNPIHDIHFVMPGYENTFQSQPFDPTFLNRIAPFSDLRFMDWMGTNNSDIVNWSDRPTPNSASYGDKGAPLEVMIDLANETHTDPWFNIPAKASDDYVRNFAQMVHDRLDPSLKANIEYTNEAWNSMFGQAQYVVQKGTELGLGSSDFEAGLHYYSERAVQIFNIFDSVFGADARSRVERVLAGQAGNSWTGEQILGWKDAYKSADAYAIAPYMYGADGLLDAGNADKIAQMTPGDIVASLKADVALNVKPVIESNYNVATKEFGLPLYAYEGGPHLYSYQFPEGLQDQITNLYAQANRDPGMRDVYHDYLNAWKDSGGALFNQFVDVSSSNKWGSWGALEYQDEDPSQAPKYEGLMDFINANAVSK